MAGLRIDIDASRGISSLKDFRKYLEDTGVAATATEREIKALEERFEKKLAADDASAALAKTRRQIEEIGRSAGLSQREIQGLSDRAGVLASKSSNLTSATGILGGSFASLALKIGTAVGAYITLREAAERAYEFVQRGISFNSQMESAALGISSVLAATQQIADMDGRRLDGQEKLNAAISLSRGIMNDIQIMGLETTATTKELVSGFQTLLGPAAEAGLTIKQTEQFVIGMVQAFGGIGIEMNQLSAEGRSLLDGTISPMQDRLATVLGISGEMVREWKQQGTLFENLNTKLQAFRLAGAETAKTWAGLSSNMEEAIDLFAGKNTEGIFEGAKKGMSSIVAMMFDLKEGSVELGPGVQNIAAGFQSISNDIGGGIASGAQLLVDKIAELNTWVGSNKEELYEIYTKTKDIAVESGDILGKFGNILTTIVSVGVETGAFSLALSLAKSIVVIIQETIGYIELAFRAVGLVVVENVCGPLAQAARLAADLGKTKLGGMVVDENQIAELEEYAKGHEATIQRFKEELNKAASRYSNTPFPAITVANKDVDILTNKIKTLNESSQKYKIVPKGGYSTSDSAKTLGGINTAQSQLNDSWKKGLDVLAVLDSKLKQGNLTNEDRTRILKDQDRVWQYISDAQETFENKANKGSKAAERAALAAERYGERASAYLDNVSQSLQGMEDSLSGGLNRESDRVDKWFTQAINQAKQAMIGAKGDTAAYQQGLDLLTASYQKFHDLAVQKDTIASLRAQADVLRELAQALGDPALQERGGEAEVTAWTAETAQKISAQAASQSKAIWDAAVASSRVAGADTVAIWQEVANKWTAIDQDRADKMGLLDAASQKKRLESTVTNYERYQGVSDKYWQARKALLEEELATVKRVADDELAFRVYAAQQEDELRRKQLESEAAYAGTFAQTLSAKWSLAFGGYKSETTKAKESWDRMSDSIIQTTDGMIDGIAGGFGDLIRNFGNGTASIEDLWRNMLSRMLDAFASFVEELVKQQLHNLVGSMFSGSGSSVTTGLFGGSSSSSSGGIGSITGGLTETKKLGEYMGKGFLNSWSGGASEASSFIKSLSKANTDGISDVFKNGNISGWNFSDGSSVTGDAIKQAAGITSSASSVLGTVGTVLGVVGAIGGVVGLLSSLFGEQKEEIKKVASGYSVSYVGGHAAASGVDFYSDGSVIGTGAADPAVTKKIADSFRNAAENLSDFADELGFATDVLEGFAMPSMNITTDQIDAYIANGINMMAFKGLMESGLRGAFDAVARDGEVYSDEYERLGTSLSAVQGKFEAYGYELSDVAQITQERIDALSATNIEVAQGTSQAMLNMASSMGATSDQLALIAANADDGSAALAVTNEQLSTILEADYASQLLDAVGGEDAFASIMGNLTANIFNSVEAYAANMDYYVERANTAISKLGDATVTVENFWQKFDAALKAGLSVDEFEAWGKASSWVANINSVQSALADWDDNMVKVAQSLDQRMIAAQGLDYQAKLAKQMADAEWELAAAREAGYSAAMLARIQEVQAAELAATKAKHQADYQKSLLDAQERIAEASDDQEALLAIQQRRNQLELQDLAKTYNWSPGSADEPLFQAIQQAQALEMQNTVRALQEAVEKATASLERDMTSREARLSGDEDLADSIAKLNEQQDELRKAYEDGIDETVIARLITLQSAEFEAYLASIDSSIISATTSLASMADALVTEMGRIIDKSVEAYTTLASQASTAAQGYHDAAQSIYTALGNWAIDDAGGNPDRTYRQTKALFDATMQKALGGNLDAYERLSGLGSSLRDAAAKVFGTREEYDAAYQDLQIKMAEAAFSADAAGDQKSELAKLYDVQVDLYNLLKTELGKDDPNTDLLAAIGTTMTGVQSGIESGNSYQQTLRDITADSAGGDGGFQVIRDAVQRTGQSTNDLMAQVAQSQVELAQLLATYMNADVGQTLLRKRDLYAAQVENSKSVETDIFKASRIGQIYAALGTVNLDLAHSTGNVHDAMIVQTTLSAFANGSGQFPGLSWLDVFADNNSEASFADWYRREPGYGSYTGGALDWDYLYSYTRQYMNNGNGAYSTRYSTFEDLIDYVIDSSMTARIQETARLQQEYEYAAQQYQDWLDSQVQSSAVNSFASVNGVANSTSGSNDIVELVSVVKSLLAEVKSLKEGTESSNSQMVLSNKKIATIVARWESGGLPATRVVSASQA